MSLWHDSSILFICPQSINRLRDSVVEKTTSQPGLSSDILEKQKMEVEQDMFTLLCCKAEAVSSLCFPYTV